MKFSLVICYNQKPVDDVLLPRRQTLWLAGAAVQMESTPIINWEKWGEVQVSHDDSSSFVFCGPAADALLSKSIGPGRSEHIFAIGGAPRVRRHARLDAKKSQCG